MLKLFERLGRWPLLTITVFGLVLLLSGNWFLPLLDRDEPRFAEASREMLQRNDFVVPYLNGEYRFDKPPLIYWCQAAAYRVLGESAFSARLPSVLFATATGWLLLLWGRRMGNERAGFFAALMFLSCLQVFIHGRLSVADMPMVFFVTAAIWIGWELSRPDTPVSMWVWLLFAGSLGLGFLAKGPVAWLPIGGLLLSRWLRPKLFRLAPVPLAGSVVVALLVVAAWGIPALRATGGDFFRVGIGRHVVQRSFDVMEGHGVGGPLGYAASLPLYFLTFFLSFFPWSFRVPSALRSWWAGRKEDDFGWYLMVQAALVFVVFSLVRTKLPHYTLPAFGCIALWLSLRGTGEKVTAWVMKGFATMCCLGLMVSLAGFPFAARRMAARQLRNVAGPYLQPEMKLAVAGFTEPSLVWEFRSVITNYAEYPPPGKIAELLHQDPPFCLIMPTATYEKRKLEIPRGAKIFRATGIDTAKFKRYDLTAVIVRAGE